MVEKGHGAMSISSQIGKQVSTMIFFYARTWSISNHTGVLLCVKINEHRCRAPTIFVTGQKHVFMHDVTMRACVHCILE